MTIKELITILKRFPKSSQVHLNAYDGDDIQVTAHVNENDDWVIVISTKNNSEVVDKD
jgi:hypothetical protein